MSTATVSINIISLFISAYFTEKSSEIALAIFLLVGSYSFTIVILDGTCDPDQINGLFFVSIIVFSMSTLFRFFITRWIGKFVIVNALYGVSQLFVFGTILAYVQVMW